MPRFGDKRNKKRKVRPKVQRTTMYDGDLTHEDLDRMRGEVYDAIGAGTFEPLGREEYFLDDIEDTTNLAMMTGPQVEWLVRIWKRATGQDED